MDDDGLSQVCASIGGLQEDDNGNEYYVKSPDCLVKVLVFLTLPVDPSSCQASKKFKFLHRFKAAIVEGDTIPVIVSLLETPLQYLERFGSCKNVTGVNQENLGGGFTVAQVSRRIQALGLVKPKPRTAHSLLHANLNNIEENDQDKLPRMVALPEDEGNASRDQRGEQCSRNINAVNLSDNEDDVLISGLAPSQKQKLNQGNKDINKSTHFSKDSQDQAPRELLSRCSVCKARVFHERMIKEIFSMRRRWMCRSPTLSVASCYWIRVLILLLLLLPTSLYAEELPEKIEGKSADMVDNFTEVKEGDGKAISGEGFSDAFVTSLSIILVSEIGDETFIIAALMAMRHPRAIVLSGALSALVVMTVLSTGLGRIVPNLISRKHTNAAATVLYTFFGARLLYIAWRADPNNTPQKELEEVEEKLEGGIQKKTNIRRFLARLLTPIFLEAFVLTFLAEWGDRSQIATIALASHKNAVGVTIGATIGHTVCTSVAVVGGRLLALRISQRTVATIGGLLFLCFAISSYIYPPV